MERQIVDFVMDEATDWKALLDCGHFQHMRHNPPLNERPWVLTLEGRTERVGTKLNCSLCDDAEIPGIAAFLSKSPLFDEGTFPLSLKKRRQSASGVWARVLVSKGSLKLHHFEPLNREAIVIPETPGVIVPGVPYALEEIGPVQFSIEFLKADI